MNTLKLYLLNIIMLETVWECSSVGFWEENVNQMWRSKRTLGKIKEKYNGFTSEQG
jgi:hypothetical protein